MRAIVTVTNKRYFKGTLVLLYSFLKQNPDFDGDIVVIHNGLEKRLKNKLVAKFKVKFENVSTELILRVEALCSSIPAYASKKYRFYSLEIFRFKSYDQTLYLDSDILCQGDLSSLFDKSASFYAAPDSAFYRNKKRDRNTFQLETDESNSLGNFQKTFNSGVMLVRPILLSPDTYENLLESITAKNYQRITTGHSDQFILNQYFENNVASLNPEWNYLAKDETVIQNKTGVKLNKAIMLHYTRFPKPWQLKKLLKLKLKGHVIPLYFVPWLRIYLEMQQKEVGLRKNYINSILVKILLLFSNPTNGN